MKMLYEVDVTMECQDFLEIQECEAIWTYRPRITVEHLAKEVRESVNTGDIQVEDYCTPPFAVLNEFLQLVSPLTSVPSYM